MPRSPYVHRCNLRWLPNRLHSYAHHRKFGRGAWKFSKIVAPTCMTTEDDMAWVQQVAETRLNGND